MLHVEGASKPHGDDDGDDGMGIANVFNLMMAWKTANALRIMCRHSTCAAMPQDIQTKLEEDEKHTIISINRQPHDLCCHHMMMMMVALGPHE